MKLFQMVLSGNRAITDSRGTFYSKKVFSKMSQITEEIKQQFIHDCTTPKTEYDLAFLDIDHTLEFFVVELDLQEEK
jgi:hypothetical protein